MKNDSEAYSYALKYSRDFGREAGPTAANDRRIDYIFGPRERVILRRVEVLRGAGVGQMDHWPLLERIDEVLEIVALRERAHGNDALYVKMAEEDIPLINTLLVQNGFRVTELSPQRESLEDVFLRLTQEARTEIAEASE